MGERIAMRYWGKRLLIGGISLMTVVGLVYLRMRYVHESREYPSGTAYDATPFVLWATVGALLLFVGAVFFAAGEAVRLLQRSAVPVRPEDPAAISRHT